MKRALSLILSMLIVLYLFPVLHSSAAETEIAESGTGGFRYTAGSSTCYSNLFGSDYHIVTPDAVSRIDLTIPEPKANTTITYSAETPADATYSINGKYGDSSSWSRGVCWTRSGNIGPMNCHVKFDFLQGKSYKVEIAVTSNDERQYPFAEADQLAATVNGYAAKVTDAGGGTYIVSREFFIPIVIDCLELTMPDPIAGDTVQYTASAPERAGYTVEDYDGLLWKNGVMWTHGTTALRPDDKDRFISGDVYSATISVVLKNNEKYVFNDVKQIKATVNGHEAQAYKISKNQYTVKYSFTVMYYLSQLAATIPAPRVGDRLKWSASVPESVHYAVSSNSSDFVANGVMWYKGDTIIAPGKNVSFEVGETYKVVVSLEAENFSLFADAADLVAFVNGCSAVATRVSDTKCLLSYTFTVTESTGVVLGDVDGDEAVTILDATAIQRRLASIPTDSYMEAAADTDEDGSVTIIDATYIQRWLANLPSNDNIGKPIT